MLYAGITILGILVVFCGFTLLAKVLKFILTIPSKKAQKIIYMIVAIIFFVIIAGSAIAFSRILKNENILSEIYFLIAYIATFFFCAHRSEKTATEDMKKIWKS